MILHVYILTVLKVSCHCNGHIMVIYAHKLSKIVFPSFSTQNESENKKGKIKLTANKIKVCRCRKRAHSKCKNENKIVLI